MDAGLSYQLGSCTQPRYDGKRLGLDSSGCDNDALPRMIIRSAARSSGANPENGGSGILIHIFCKIERRCGIILERKCEFPRSPRSTISAPSAVGCVSVVLRYCSVSGFSWCFSVRIFGVHSARLSKVAIFWVVVGGWGCDEFSFLITIVSTRLSTITCKATQSQTNLTRQLMSASSDQRLNKISHALLAHHPRTLHSSNSMKPPTTPANTSASGEVPLEGHYLVR